MNKSGTILLIGAGTIILFLAATNRLTSAYNGLLGKCGGTAQTGTTVSGATPGSGTAGEAVGNPRIQMFPSPTGQLFVGDSGGY